MRKVNMTDDLPTIAATLSEGNPGALMCLMEVARVSKGRPLVLPYCLMMFEKLKLRGASLYMLWNDCLDRSMGALIRLVDYWRNDAIDEETILKHVNAEGGRGFPLPMSREVIY